MNTSNQPSVSVDSVDLKELVRIANNNRMALERIETKLDLIVKAAKTNVLLRIALTRVGL